MNKQNFQQQARANFNHNNNSNNPNKNRKKNNQSNDENKFNGAKNFNNPNNINNINNINNSNNKVNLPKPKPLPDDFVSSYISNVVSPPSPSKSFGSGHELNDQSNHFYHNRSPNKFHNNHHNNNNNKRNNKKFGRSTSNNNIESNNGQQTSRMTTSPSDPTINSYMSNGPESPHRFNSMLNELKRSPTKLSAMSEETKLGEMEETAPESHLTSGLKPEIEVVATVSEPSLLASVESETMNSTIVKPATESPSDKNSHQNTSITVSEMSENMYFSADETNQAQTSLSDFESFKLQSSSSTSPASSKSSEETETKELDEVSFSENVENKTLHDDAVELKETMVACEHSVATTSSNIDEVEKQDEDFVIVEAQAESYESSETVEAVVEQQEALIKCDSMLFFRDGRQNVDEILNRSFEVENTTAAEEKPVNTDAVSNEAVNEPVVSEVVFEPVSDDAVMQMASNEVVSEVEMKPMVSLLPQESPLDFDIESEHDISTTSIDMENKVTISEECHKEQTSDVQETNDELLSSPADSSKTASTNLSDFEMSVNFSFKPSSSISDEEQLKPSDFENLKSLESSESSERSLEDKSESSAEMVTVDLEAPAEDSTERISVEKFNEIESQELNSLVNKIVADVISHAVAVAPNPLMIDSLESRKDDAQVNEVNLETELKEALAEVAEISVAEKKDTNANNLTPVSSSLSLFKKLSPSQAVKAKLNDKKQVVASDVDCFGCTIV